jgi:hypothetical protein
MDRERPMSFLGKPILEIRLRDLLLSVTVSLLLWYGIVRLFKWAVMRP